MDSSTRVEKGIFYIRSLTPPFRAGLHSLCVFMEKQEAIQWQSWSMDAFQQAQEQGKPIFLSISAAWCHWCHVLDEESFTHPEVIRRINADFIPIRVDSDKRPDLNSRYNMGGWPTVAILDPQGELVTGGTYMPTGQLLAMLSNYVQGPSFSPTPGNRPDRASSPLLTQQVSKIDPSMIETIAGFLERVFDRNFGGFGGPPKFPQVWAIELVFHLHAKTGEKKWLEMATLTLDNMREGGLYDPIDGGFFRYSASDDWDSPHYEKLLEVNAQMLSIYLKSYILTGQVTYRATAQGILDYLFSTLAKAPVSGSDQVMLQALPEHGGRGTPTSHSEPWFCGSQSADRDYYEQSEEERVWADAPPLDSTLYTDRNAMAVSALLIAHHVFGDSQYRDRALKLIDFLWEHCYRKEQGMFHYYDEKGNLSLGGYLSDQVHMMAALMDAFEATGIRLYLDRAEALSEVMDHYLWDHRDGGYWDLPDSSDSLGALKVKIKPFAENAIASMLMTRLSHLTGQEDYLKKSEAVLSYLSTIYGPYKYHAAPFALALERFHQSPHHVSVVGNPADAHWAELLLAAHRLKSPWKVVLPLDVKKDSKRLKSLGYSPSDESLAYLCIGKTCFPPISRAEDLYKLPSKLC